jgi:hypothetical protein
MSTEEEPTQTLPVGHPQAGYVRSDLSEHVDTGTLPDEEKEWHEKRNQEREDQLEQVEKSEDEAAKEEQEERERQAKEAEEQRENDPAVVPPATSTPPVKSSKATSGS